MCTAGDAAPPSDGGPGEGGPPPTGANDVFVDPVSGTDTNTGKAGAPFKTLGKAFTAVPTGAAVHLLDGTYDAVSEGSAAPLTVPDGVIVRAENVRKATIAGLTVAADGTMISVYDVVFDLGSVLRAKNVAAAGKVLISGCQFVHRQTSHAVLNVGGAHQAIPDWTAPFGRHQQ